MQTTMYDLTITLEDRPGTLSKATEVIAAERINLEGGTGYRCGGEGIFHALFKTEQDANTAKRALEKTGIKVRGHQPVVVVDAEDTPGAAAKVFRKIADTDINLEFTYLATNTRVVIGSSQPERIARLFGTPAATGARR